MKNRYHLVHSIENKPFHDFEENAIVYVDSVFCANQRVNNDYFNNFDTISFIQPFASDVSAECVDYLQKKIGKNFSFQQIQKKPITKNLYNYDKFDEFDFFMDSFDIGDFNAFNALTIPIVIYYRAKQILKNRYIVESECEQHCATHDADILIYHDLDVLILDNILDSVKTLFNNNYDNQNNHDAFIYVSYFELCNDDLILDDRTNFQKIYNYLNELSFHFIHNPQIQTDKISTSSDSSVTIKEIIKLKKQLHKLIRDFQEFCEYPHNSNLTELPYANTYLVITKLSQNSQIDDADEISILYEWLELSQIIYRIGKTIDSLENMESMYYVYNNTDNALNAVAGNIIAEVSEEMAMAILILKYPSRIKKLPPDLLLPVKPVKNDNIESRMLHYETFDNLFDIIKNPKSNTSIRSNCIFKNVYHRLRKKGKFSIDMMKDVFMK